MCCVPCPAQAGLERRSGTATNDPMRHQKILDVHPVPCPACWPSLCPPTPRVPPHMCRIPPRGFIPCRVLEHSGQEVRATAVVLKSSAWDVGLHFPVIKYTSSSVGILKCPWDHGVKFLGPGRGRAFPGSSDRPAGPRVPKPEGRPGEDHTCWDAHVGEMRRRRGLQPGCSSWNSIGVSSQLCQGHTQWRLLYLFRSAQSMALRTRDAHL